MNNTQNGGLDPITLRILTLLSGGQKLKLYDLARVMETSMDSIWVAVQLLLEQSYIEASQGRYMLAEKGLEYLAKKGITAALPDDDPAPKDFKNKYKIPFFGTMSAFAEWITPLLVAFTALGLLSFAFVLQSKATFFVLGTMAVYIAFIVLYIKRSYHFVLEDEKLVVFRMGKSIGAKGPGPILVIPVIDHVRRVDMRELSQEVKGEVCLTKDNLILNTGFVITWKVDDAPLSLKKLSDASATISSFASAILKTVISEYEMKEALGKRKAINNLVQTKMERIASEWGLSLTSMEIREMQPTDGVMKSMQNKFTAGLEKDAALTKSDGQVESLQKIMRLGASMSPNAMNLKYLETLEKIGEGPATKYIIPMEFFNLLKELLQKQANVQGNEKKPTENNPSGIMTSNNNSV